MPVPGNSERKPYRLVRGAFSRRDGNKVARRDDAGKKIGMSQPFTHYRARTADNPNARDEIYLTDAEAKALGRRVVPLVSGTVEAEAFDKDRVKEGYTLDQLISIGQAVSGTRSMNEFRDMVFKSGLIVGEKLPNKKHDLLALLRKIKADIAAEASTLGLGPLDGVKTNA